MITEVIAAALLTVAPAPPNPIIPVVPRETAALLERQETERKPKSNRRERRMARKH